jgi:hypothetical protein
VVKRTKGDWRRRRSCRESRSEDEVVGIVHHLETSEVLSIRVMAGPH